jgi:outer membrane protein assembly factor BamD (BamD/ComL family)
VAQAYNLQVAAQARAGRKAALGKEIVNEAPASAVGALVRSQSEEIAESGKLGEAAREQAAQMTAVELANRQDRINADLRLAVVAYDRVVKNYPLGDFADDSLLRMADIYYVNLKDTPKAMATYELLVQHYPGTAVSEEAAGKLGPYYEKEAKWREAIKAYQQYIYNFPQGKLVQDACFAIAGCQEQLEDWVAAMDAYQAFIDKFPNVPASQKAKDRISWIKTYRLGRD